MFCHRHRSSTRTGYPAPWVCACWSGFQEMLSTPPLLIGAFLDSLMIVFGMIKGHNRIFRCWSFWSRVEFKIASFLFQRMLSVIECTFLTEALAVTSIITTKKTVKTAALVALCLLLSKCIIVAQEKRNGFHHFLWKCYHYFIFHCFVSKAWLLSPSVMLILGRRIRRIFDMTYCRNGDTYIYPSDYCCVYCLFEKVFHCKSLLKVTVFLVFFLQVCISFSFSSVQSIVNFLPIYCFCKVVFDDTFFIWIIVTLSNPFKKILDHFLLLL